MLQNASTFSIAYKCQSVSGNTTYLTIFPNLSLSLAGTVRVTVGSPRPGSKLRFEPQRISTRHPPHDIKVKNVVTVTTPFMQLSIESNEASDQSSAGHSFPSISLPYTNQHPNASFYSTLHSTNCKYPQQTRKPTICKNPAFEPDANSSHVFRTQH